MASGLTYAADHGAKIVNLSFAGGSGSTTVRDAVRYAHDRGLVITVSAGNYGTSSPTYPAAYPGAIAVAGTEANDALVSTSSYGSWVHVAAPGCNYSGRRASASSPYGQFCGTSSAAPALAGIVGLAFSQSPAASNTAVEQALFDSAVPIGAAVANGRVDAWGTLAALGAVAPPASAPIGRADPMVLQVSGAAVAGAPQPGSMLAASPGGWIGTAPMSTSYQWLRCDASGAACAPISGASIRTYTPTSSDSGSTVRTVVTVGNARGSASATSPATAVVGGSAPVGSAPVSTAPPAVSGTATEGSTLSASTGAWSNSPTAYTYQWLRCDQTGAACSSIAGATATTYALGAGDVGAIVRVRVTASNTYGSADGTSAPTAVVSAAPTTATTTFTGSLNAKNTSQSYDPTVGAGDADAALTFTKASNLTLTLKAPDGSTVASASGPSAVRLLRTLPAGTYRYVVSGFGGKGSASFSLSVTSARG